MTWLVSALRTSIGKKQLVAISGLGLCVFLVAHLAGNFLILAGQEAFDAYAKRLEDNPWILIPAEIALAATFAIHIGFAIRVSLENRKARPARYVVHSTRGAATAASTTMLISGLIVLVFLVIHLANFKLGDRIDGSLYRLVVATFQRSTAYVAWYVAASCILGFHLSHGLQSAIQTLGLNEKRTAAALRKIGYGFAVVIALGYSALPIYASFFAERIE